MSNIKSVNFYDLCRVCTTTATMEKIDIFSAEGKSKNLNSKMNECLPILVEETDRLPKVICQQCVNLLDNFTEFRNICRNSQIMLNSCLESSENGGGGKVLIKDIITSGGKSTSVLNNVTNSLAIQQSAGPIFSQTHQQIPIQQPPIFSLQGSNLVAQTMPTTIQNQDLNAIMQAVAMQSSENSIKPEKPSIPQYTITVDNSAQQSLLQQQTNQTSFQAAKEKETKNTALEEFLKLKPNIKVTPISKKPSPGQQEQLLQQQQQQQQHHQQQQEQMVQLQLQQLQQQLQLLTSQLQPQQITITAPPLQTPINSTISASDNNTAMSTSDAEDSSPSKNKKPKLNFVLTQPQPTVPANSATTLSATLPQLVNPSQIQFQLQPTLQQPNTTATLLSNLAPLLQPQTQHINALLQSQSLAQSAPSFLPITIKDENTDQQYVAHIDAKNFLLPTTYQLQMKLQPQITGQQIMQLAPTLQLTTNPSFPGVTSLNSNISSLNSNSQSLPVQIASTQIQQQQPLISKQHIITTTNQQPSTESNPPLLKQPTSAKNIEITSQQIINPGNIKQEPQTTSDAEQNQKSTESGENISRPKYKLAQSAGGNSIEITPTTSFTQKIMQQVQEQQQQKHQQKVLTAAAAVTQHGGITVQRINAKTNQNAAPASNETHVQSSKPANPQSSQANLPKLPILNKNNITISRVVSINQPGQNKQPMPNNNQTIKVTPKTIGSTTTNVKTVTQIQKPRQSLPTTQQKPPQQTKSLANTAPAAKQQPNQFQTQKSQVLSNIPNTTVRFSPTKKIMKKIEKPPAPEAANPVEQNTSSTTHSNVSLIEEPLHGPDIVDNRSLTDTGQNTIQNNNIECSQCGRAFKKKEHLTQHLKLHTGIRPFKCNEEGCPKAFHRKEHLLRHLVSHSGKKMFSCDICQKPFSRKDNLSKHRKIHGETNTNNYDCEICHKSFVVKAYYIQHKLLHKTKALPLLEENHKPEEVEETNEDDDHSEEKETQNTSDYQNQASIVAQAAAAISQQQEQLQKQQQQQQQTLQLVQQQLQQLQGQPQIMQLQLPSSMVTTQSGNTITIQTSTDPNANTLKAHETTVLNLPATSLANFVQLSQAQFVNPATGQIMGHLKIEK